MYSKKELDEAYYNTGHPLISDKEYDELYPTNLNEVGILPSEVNHKNIVKLPCILGSLKKIYTDKEFKKWVKDNDDFYIGPKLDGVCAFVYKNKAYTKGNGSLGMDITFKVPHIFKDIPNDYFGYRGELVIPKTVDAGPRASQNRRSYVSGIINRKDFCEESAQIDFVVFEIIDLMSTIQMSTLEQSAILSCFKNYVKWERKEEGKTFEEYYGKYQNLNYEIDGIVLRARNVVTSHLLYPKDIIAFKFKDFNTNEVTTNVISIEWNLSKNNLFIPKIILNPVYVSGTRITKVSGFNLKFLLENGIGVGSIVSIVKSGEVIPNFKRCIVKVEPSLIYDTFPPFSSIEGNDLVCIDPNNEELKVQKLLHFIKAVKIKGIRIGVVNKLFNAGITTPFKFLEIDNETLSIFNPHLKNVIVEGIKQARSDFVSFLFGLEAFGPGIGKQRIEMYMTEFSINENPSVFEIANIKGFSIITAQKIRQSYDYRLRCLNYFS